MHMTHDPRYPIGKLTMPAEWNAADRAGRIEIIAQTPGELRGAVQGWSDAQLATPYREGGWTVRQLAHHVAHIRALAGRMGW
jgi:hypothetical protein